MIRKCIIESIELPKAFKQLPCRGKRPNVIILNEPSQLNVEVFIKRRYNAKCEVIGLSVRSEQKCELLRETSIPTTNNFKQLK